MSLTFDLIDILTFIHTPGPPLDISFYFRLKIPLLLSARPPRPRRCRGKLCCWGSRGRPACSDTWSPGQGHHHWQGALGRTCHHSYPQSLSLNDYLLQCVDNDFNLTSNYQLTKMSKVRLLEKLFSMNIDENWINNKPLPFRLDLDSVKKYGFSSCFIIRVIGRAGVNRVTGVNNSPAPIMHKVPAHD